MDRPNFLFLSLDSVRADACSFLRGPDWTTPSLDGFADSATVFTRAVTPSVWTLPVHASVFTGLYPPEHQIFDHTETLGPVATLGERLSGLGYDTRAFGYNKWLEVADIARGFDHHTTPPVVSPASGATGTASRAVAKLRSALFRHRIRDQLTVERVLDNLGENGEPFSYFVHLNGAHHGHGYKPHSPHHRRATDKSLPELLLHRMRQRRIFESEEAMYTESRPYSDQTIETMRSLYHGCVSQVDELVGELFDALEREGLFENTVVVVFADHGDNLDEDGMIGHQFSVADPLIRVPLLVSDPTGRLGSGTRGDIVQLTDIYPTVFDLLGEDYERPNAFSLTSQNARDTAYAYYETPSFFHERIGTELASELPPDRQYVAWRTPDEKLIWYPDEASFQGQHSLRENLRNHHASLEPVRTRDGTELREDVRNNLEQMGYL